MPKPRELDELPYASYLQPLPEPLEAGGRYETVSLEATEERSEIDDAVASSGRFLEVAISGITFNAGTFQHSRLTDIWVRGARWIGTDLVKTSWMDVEMIGCIMAGVQMFDAVTRRVIFYESKLDSVNLRSATLEDTSFVDCQLTHVDFSGATLKNVSFPGSRLQSLRFEGAKLKKVDFRGAVELGIEAGHDSLGGATITPLQLMEIAPHFAAALGISVKDG